MLHRYANLYFHARNPMMYTRKDIARELCVLRISTDVAKLDGTVFADCNASSNWVRFLAPSQWAELDVEAIYAMDWTHPDPAQYYARKSKKCAEALVLDRVGPEFLIGAYVVDEHAAAELARQGFVLPVAIDPVLFFG